MPPESKSYFVHSHSNFRRASHYLSFSVSPLLRFPRFQLCLIFFFLFVSSFSLFIAPFLSAVVPKEITNEYVMRPSRQETATEISRVVSPVLRFIGAHFIFPLYRGKGIPRELEKPPSAKLRFEREPCAEISSAACEDYIDKSIAISCLIVNYCQFMYL